MKKVTSLSNDQFNILIADKRELKKFMKYPQNEKIEKLSSRQATLRFYKRIKKKSLKILITC